MKRTILLLLLVAACIEPVPPEPDAGPSPYLVCMDICQALETDGLLCGERPRYPVSECSAICSERIVP